MEDQRHDQGRRDEAVGEKGHRRQLADGVLNHHEGQTPDRRDRYQRQLGEPAEADLAHAAGRGGPRPAAGGPPDTCAAAGIPGSRGCAPCRSGARAGSAARAARTRPRRCPQPQHLVVRALESRALRPEPEPGAHPVHVRVHGHLGAADTRTAARRRRSCGPRRAARRGSRAPPRAERPPSTPGRRRPSASRICLIRTALVGASPPGRIASSISSTGAARTSSHDEKRSRSRA